MNDEQVQRLLDRARQGDREALGELFESQRPYLQKVMNNMWPDQVRARAGGSDGVQDAVFQAVRSFGTFEGTTVGQLRAWLRAIGFHCVRAELRGQMGTQKRDLKRDQALVDPGQVAAGSSNSPVGQAMAREEEARLTAALARLPEAMRLVMLARHVEGVPHKQIAERLGRSENDVRQLYYRGLRRLRAELEPEQPDGVLG